MRLVPGGTRSTGRGGALRRSGIAAVLGAVALLLASCHMPGGSSAAGGVKGQLTVAVVAGPDTAPLTVALKQGTFAQQGVTVTVRPYATLRAAYQAMAKGQVAILGGDYADVFYQVANGMGPKLRLVADGYDATLGTMEVMTLPPSGRTPNPITSPQDLIGQKVATPENQLAPFVANVPYNIQTLATESVLQGDGVSPSSVVWQPMPASQMIHQLRTHQVAAIVATEPYILEAETQLGAVELIDSCNGVTGNLPLSGYFTTVKYAHGNAALLREFRTGLAQAQSAAAQRGSVQTVLADQPGMNAQFASLVDLGAYPTFLSVGQVQRVADLMYDSGMTVNQISVRNLVFR
jgi:NitT/TauT family transport system substrate-binding protein